MPKRNLTIVKLRPVAIGVCDACNMEFHSKQPLEDDAEIRFRDSIQHPRASRWTPVKTLTHDYR